ncbi:unnamed protein product [Paramecium pentaurelia]|uniref:Uncharacterized protein n=1 Tax=Paramecium pentaurelia TaxID=43138 RepID=A0A8S1VA07_9CILI|nr:unnamed protein product [Paramecium pentaurelia]
MHNNQTIDLLKLILVQGNNQINKLQEGVLQKGETIVYTILLKIKTVKKEIRMIQNLFQKGFEYSKEKTS